MILVVNLRAGFACNSSSSHSMVLIRQEDNRSEDFDYSNEDPESLLRQGPEKEAHFLHALCLEAQKQGVDPRMALMAGRELLCNHKMEPMLCSSEQGHSMCFPAGFVGKGAHSQFAKELLEFVRHKDLAFDYSEADERFLLPFSEESNSLTARKDPENGLWTIFNRHSGAKVRFALVPGEALEWDEADGATYGIDPNAKAYAPELVDVKITESCSGMPCEAYCYQASGPKGKHARLVDVAMSARLLGEQEVFEVALGGGNPLSHPHFTDILRVFRANGVVPNLTSRKTDWIDINNEQFKAVMTYAGAVAFSVDNAQQADNARALFEQATKAWRKQRGDAWRENYTSFSVQHVVGTESEQRLKELLVWGEKTNNRITLLGYKDVGKGKIEKGRNQELKQQVEDLSTRWLKIAEDVAKRKGYLYLSIDTALAEKCSNALKAIKVSGILWHQEEGRFSAYIDAVRLKCAPSSYAPESAKARIGEDFLDQFKAFGVVPADKPYQAQKPFGCSASNTEAAEELFKGICANNEALVFRSLEKLPENLNHLAARTALGLCIGLGCESLLDPVLKHCSLLPEEAAQLLIECAAKDCAVGISLMGEIAGNALDVEKILYTSAANGSARAALACAQLLKTERAAQMSAQLNALSGDLGALQKIAQLGGEQTRQACLSGIACAVDALNANSSFDTDIENAWDQNDPDIKKAKEDKLARQAAAERMVLGAIHLETGAPAENQSPKTKSI